MRDSTELTGVHLDTVQSNDKAKEKDRRGMKFTLFHFHVELMLEKSLRTRGEDENIINVNKHKNVHFTEDIIH